MTKTAQYKDAMVAIAYVLAHNSEPMTFSEIASKKECSIYSFMVLRRAIGELDKAGEVVISCMKKDYERRLVVSDRVDGTDRQR